jgi:lysophospholipase L1-like esterase
VDPEPFIRGRAFPGNQRVPYPRAKPEDFMRLPIDTWAVARVPVGIRLEFVGDARAVEIEYRTHTDNFGYRGVGAGHTFDLWVNGGRVAEIDAELGSGKATVTLPEWEAERAIVYLPEGMKPTITSLEPVDGSIEPGPPQPRWVAYGDSVAEGWIASGPALSWPAVAGRDQGLDMVNMGYASAARGEMVSAEHVAEVEADVISITHGTNCWTRIPHSVAMFEAGLHAFLDVVRQGHPDTPILVSSPVVRPDAEETPNRLGATLADLRRAMEDVVGVRMKSDPALTIVPGGDLIDASMLGDAVHPNDEGHAKMAAVLGPVLRGLIDERSV